MRILIHGQYETTPQAEDTLARIAQRHQDEGMGRRHAEDEALYDFVEMILTGTPVEVTLAEVIEE